LNPETLETEATWPLAGRAQIGPVLAGGAVFVSSEADGLHCLGSGQQLRWKTPLSHGPLAGPPIKCEADFLLVAQSGHIVRIAGDTGAEIALADLAEALGAAGHVVGPQLFVATSDGAVVMVPVPKPQ
jgi:hypothetical protein